MLRPAIVLGLTGCLSTLSAQAAPPASDSDVVARTTRTDASSISLLHRFDRDHDGAFSENELRDIRLALRREVLQRFDIDEDGELSAAERTHARAIHQQVVRRAALGQSSPSGDLGRLRRFDTNGDGRFDSRELERVRGALEHGVLARHDRNADGVLDDSERATIRRAFARRAAPGGPLKRAPGTGSDDAQAPEPAARQRRAPAERRAAPGIGQDGKLSARGRRPAPPRRPAPGPGAESTATARGKGG